MGDMISVEDSFKVSMKSLPVINFSYQCEHKWMSFDLSLILAINTNLSGGKWQGGL